MLPVFYICCLLYCDALVNVFNVFFIECVCVSAYVYVSKVEFVKCEENLFLMYHKNKCSLVFI